MQEEASKTSNKLNIPTAIVLAGAIVGAALFFQKTGDDGVVKDQNNLSVISSVGDTDFIRGDETASITLIEYADFSCPYCAHHHETLKKLVENNSELRWVYRHLPIFNMDAAAASECVGQIAGNDAFWEFSDILYENQSALYKDFYRQTALGMGVSDTEYDTCFSSQLIRSKIDADFDRVRILLGFKATPHNVIVDKQGRTFSFSGAISEEDLQSIIEGLL